MALRVKLVEAVGTTSCMREFIAGNYVANLNAILGFYSLEY